MSEMESATPDTKSEPTQAAPRRRRWHWNTAGVGIALVAVAAVLYLWFTSQAFENLVRRRLVAELQSATGGRVEMRSFHWHLLDLDAEAAGLVIHGNEPAGEAPYATVERIHVRFSVLSYLSPRVLLRDLEITNPALHVIFYRDGTTNQPHPAKPKKQSRSGIETLFEMQAGHIAVEQGMIDLDNRADELDSQNRYQPLDFQADDLSVQMKYVGATQANPEKYHVNASVRDLNLLRGVGTKLPSPPVHGYFEASLDLTRDVATLQSLRITARTRGGDDQTLNISGALSNFAHPQWQAKLTGKLDNRLLNPVIGYPAAPRGIDRLDLKAAGRAGHFAIDGTVHIDHGAYIDAGVVAKDLQLDTRVHADEAQLHISAIDVRLAQGGRIQGDLLLDHWLPVVPGTAVLEAAPSNADSSSRRGKRLGDRPGRQKVVKPQPPPAGPHDVLVKSPISVVPVNGHLTAQFNEFPVDTVLDLVGSPPFQRLGIDGNLNGPATAEWVHGDVKTLSVKAMLSLKPLTVARAGEAQATGAIEGTYTQRDGAVDLRRLEVNLPNSQVLAHGHLGAYPLSSPTQIAVDVQSHDLNEFDTLFRSLGLERNGKSGTAALPVSVGSNAEFHGTWAGSLQSPRLAGDLKATQLALEMPANEKSRKMQLMRWDSLEANGSYAAERIAVVHGTLRHGAAQVDVSGSLSGRGFATSETTALKGHSHGNENPSFDGDSLLKVRVRASKVEVKDLLPLAGLDVPVTGILNAQIDTDGPLRALVGSGRAEVDDAVVYGEPLSRIRAQGSFANRSVRLSAVTASAKAGSVAASGSYDFRSNRFEVNAHGEGIDIAKIERLRAAGDSVAGKLVFSAAASGTLDDPAIEGHASLQGLNVSGEHMGAVQLTAHTVDHSIVYDATTGVESTQLKLHGQTQLRGDYNTQAKMDFSRFDIGAIFRLAHVEGITGQSSLAGTATVAGPLARPETMRGEIRVQEVAVTVSGVHLQSEGGLHATLANSVIRLDPLHVTGDGTDLHAQGSLALKDSKRVDFAASGAVNMKLAEMLDSDVTASGTTTFQVEAHGPLDDPGLRGRIDFNNGAIALEDLPNGLSELHGSLEFNENRLEVKTLTATTGGGQLSLGGYLAYQKGIYADLSVTGKNIRIRYPEGVSSLADTTLHLQGTRTNLLLSGNVLLTRFSVSPDLDIAALASQATAVQPVASPDAPSNHVRLDVRVQSSPQLNFQNAYAKLAGDVDLRLRGTLASPSLLGRVSITEGNATIAGTRYELQRGDITFTNPVRIQPIIDLNATARVEDYDITLGLHGTPDKLAVTYRSDPPLPQADVVALLALGRTQSEQGLYTQQQQQSAGVTPSTDVLLGGALNATVSSRVQKLFGAGSVKVDPSYLGALGNSTTRITVEEQLGKNVTLTYATNVDTSAQQLLQAEIAINRHVSLLVSRDESDVFSIVVKATRRYR